MKLNVMADTLFIYDCITPLT